MDLSTKIIRNSVMAWRVIDAQALVVNPGKSLIFPLNSVATRIWELLDGEKNCQEIIAVIASEFEAEAEKIQQDTITFIDQLLNDGLALVV